MAGADSGYGATYNTSGGNLDIPGMGGQQQHQGGIKYWDWLVR